MFVDIVSVCGVYNVERQCTRKQRWNGISLNRDSSKRFIHNEITSVTSASNSRFLSTMLILSVHKLCAFYVNMRGTNNQRLKSKI